MPLRFKFHISCCGRSGSKFVAAALRNMGLSVLHEMGDDWPFPSERGIKFIPQNQAAFVLYDGIIGWKWSMMTPKIARNSVHQLHLVREPIAAIESATTHLDSLFRRIESTLGEPTGLESTLGDENKRLLRAVHYWVRYNETYGSEKQVILLEEFQPGGRSFESACDTLEIPEAPRMLASLIPKDVNARKKATRRVKASVERIQEVAPTYLDRLKALAEEYGYESFS